MSGYPPPGPPHYGQHPPPPTPMQPGVAFVPTPVYMPAYPHPGPPPPPSNSTYVTNIYQQPSVVGEPYNHQLEADIDWVPANTANANTLEHRALVAGREGHDGSPLWVIRSHYGGDCVPGKLAIRHRTAYIPHSGREVPILNFEVLCTKPYGVVRWLPSSNGQVPVGAIPAGNTANAEPLYIARVPHQGSITPGKVHPSHGCCYISFGGMEIPFKRYEVLCQIVG